MTLLCDEFHPTVVDAVLENWRVRAANCILRTIHLRRVEIALGKPLSLVGVAGNDDSPLELARRFTF